MKKIIITVTFALLAVTATFGQQKVAIYVTGGENEGIDKTLRYELMSALHKHKDKYILVERQITYLDIVQNEMCYQRSGQVDDNDIVCIGKQLGAEMVCIGEVNKLLGSIQISARFVDVLSVEIKTVKSLIVPGTSPSANDVVVSCKKLAAMLVGEINDDETEQPKERTKTTTPKTTNKTPKPTCITKGGCFGLDVGVGFGLGLLVQDNRSYLDGHLMTKASNPHTGITFAIGPRYTYSFSPHFGAGFKLNVTFGLTSASVHEVYGNRYEYGNGHYYTVQFLPGIRGNSPTFYKCMSVYGVIRLGYGIGNSKYQYDDMYYENHWNWVEDKTGYRTQLLSGFCMETELGVNITKKIFAGFVYNIQCYYSNYNGEILSIIALRVGYNFGKNNKK